MIVKSGPPGDHSERSHACGYENAKRLTFVIAFVDHLHTNVSCRARDQTAPAYLHKYTNVKENIQIQLMIISLTIDHN